MRPSPICPPSESDHLVPYNKPLHQRFPSDFLLLLVVVVLQFPQDLKKSSAHFIVIFEQIKDDMTCVVRK